MPLPQKRLIPGLLLMLVIAALADSPLWWGTGTSPVIPPGAVANNKGPANIGQAKHIVSEALKALDAAAPAIATNIRSDLATSQPDLLVVPNPKTPEWIGKQKAPLLLGQLKAIADPFYTRLNAAAPAWIEAERTANGSNYAGSIFPWTSATNDDANKAIANIGQLKSVFSLHFTQDTDSDGLSDLQEMADLHIIAGALNLSLTSNDLDNDGVTNLEEVANGTNPLTADSDGDGVPDNLDAYPLDPERTSFTPGGAGDTTAPLITLLEPTDAVPIP